MASFFEYPQPGLDTEEFNLAGADNLPPNRMEACMGSCISFFTPVPWQVE
jgi:hypothetical protein